jgi:hypothetical protein
VFVISISTLIQVGAFLLVWAVCYLFTIMMRFGSDLTWKSELVAVVVALIPPVLVFTDLVKFVV